MHLEIAPNRSQKKMHGKLQFFPPVKPSGTLIKKNKESVAPILPRAYRLGPLVSWGELHPQENPCIFGSFIGQPHVIPFI